MGMGIHEGMGIITVKKAELLTVLKKNKEAHRELFLEAQKGFRELAIDELDRMLKDAREGKHIKLAVQLEQPVDYTKDYNRIIRMLEMSVEEEIKITEDEFSRYVMDDWGWKRQFVTTTSNYVGANRSR